MSTVDDLASMPDRRRAFMALAGYFQRCTKEERQDLIANWPLGAKWEYPSPWTLAWPDDSGFSPEERMVASLICDCLEGQGPDRRDDIMGFAVVYASARLAGIDPKALFSRVIEVAPPRTGEAMRSFLARPEEDKSMDAFMLKVKHDAAGRPKLAISV
jgi:hypothetical protein